MPQDNVVTLKRKKLALKTFMQAFARVIREINRAPNAIIVGANTTSLLKDLETSVDHFIWTDQPNAVGAGYVAFGDDVPEPGEVETLD